MLCADASVPVTPPERVRLATTDAFHRTHPFEWDLDNPSQASMISEAQEAAAAMDTRFLVPAIPNHHAVNPPLSPAQLPQVSTCGIGITVIDCIFVLLNIVDVIRLL